MAARLSLRLNPVSQTAMAGSAALVDDPVWMSNEQLIGPGLTRLVDVALGVALAVVFFTLTVVLAT